MEFEAKRKNLVKSLQKHEYETKPEAIKKKLIVLICKFLPTVVTSIAYIDSTFSIDLGSNR